MKEGHQIIHGDCLIEMQKIPDGSIDLVITDPPYNIGDTNKRTKVGDKIVSNMEAWGKWDNYDPKEFDTMIGAVLFQSFRLLKKGGVLYMFTAREDNGFFIRMAKAIGFKYLNQLAIIKTNPLPHFTKTNYRSGFELCMYLCKGEKPETFNFLSQETMINTFPYLIGKKDTDHPTEKPLEFFKKLVMVSSNESDLILDPFAGSCTTLIACKQLNRRCICIEKEEDYVKICHERLSATSNSLFT